MVFFTLGDAPRIQTIPFYISNPLDSFTNTAGSIYPAPTDSKKGFV